MYFGCNTHTHTHTHTPSAAPTALRIKTKSFAWPTGSCHLPCVGVMLAFFWFLEYTTILPATKDLRGMSLPPFKS